MALVDYSYLNNVLFLARVRKRPDKISMYRKVISESLRRLGPRINGELSEETSFIELYPKAVGYAIQTGDTEPLDTWNIANEIYQRMILLKLWRRI